MPMRLYIMLEALLQGHTGGVAGQSRFKGVENSSCDCFWAFLAAEQPPTNEEAAARLGCRKPTEWVTLQNDHLVALMNSDWSLC